MNRHEFKPGDVALVELPSGGKRLGVLIDNNGLSERCWHMAQSDGGLDCRAADAVTARPVVVIDPEDREQVERLGRAIFEAHGNGGTLTWGDMAERALRSLIAPSKPPEPTGLGAVVEDAKGERWVRRGLGAWVSEHKAGFEEYADIDATKVLNQGVTS